MLSCTAISWIYKANEARAAISCHQILRKLGRGAERGAVELYEEAEKYVAVGRTRVRAVGGLEEFKVVVGPHQGPALRWRSAPETRGMKVS